jgi:hypothetical protein
VGQFLIVTINVLGVPLMCHRRRRLDLIADTILKVSPNVVMLQEVWDYRALCQLQLRLKHVLPHCSYERGRFGPRGALVTFTKDKPLNQRYYPFSQRKRDFGRGLGKGVLVMKLATGPTVVNFHFSSNPWNDSSKVTRCHKAQSGQSRMLIEIINGFWGAVVMAGDSNTKLGGQLYQQLRDGARLTIFSDGKPTYFGPRGKRWCLDFVAVRGLTMGGATVIRPFRGQARHLPPVRLGFVSDHEGIGVQLSEVTL